VAEVPIFSSKEQAFLRALVDNNVEFMLVGLSAATLQGAPVVTQDIDLWFKDLNDPAFHRSIQEVDGTYIPPFQHHPPALVGASLELFDIVTHMTGLGSFDEERNFCVLIPFEGFNAPVLTLERIIQSKRAANRKKDQLVLAVLEDVLLTTTFLKK
jgi:hypothetical protein